MQSQPLLASPTALMAVGYANPAPSDLNKINMDIRGDQVLLSGLLDLKGLRLLEKRIEGLKALLAPLDESCEEEEEDSAEGGESPAN